MSLVVARRRRFSPSRILTLLVANLVWVAPILLVPATSAFAATIAVTTAADDSGTPAGVAANCPGAACSLRDAIAAANAAPGSVIDLSGLGNATIVLGAPLPQITVDMTISGPSNPNLIVVSGANAYDTFTVSIPTAASATVNLSGFTIAFANAATTAPTANYGYGGGLMVYPAGTAPAQTVIVNLDNMVFHDNKAVAGGGAILSEASTAITNSSFYNNSTPVSGGAIYSNGTMSLQTSAVYSNYAGSQGSGVFNEATNGGTLLMSDALSPTIPLLAVERSTSRPAQPQCATLPFSAILPTPGEILPMPAL